MKLANPRFAPAEKLVPSLPITSPLNFPDSHRDAASEMLLAQLILLKTGKI